MELVFSFTTIVIQGYNKSRPRTGREVLVDLIRDKFNISFKEVCYHRLRRRRRSVAGRCGKKGCSRKLSRESCRYKLICHPTRYFANKWGQTFALQNRLQTVLVRIKGFQSKFILYPLRGLR